MQTVPAATLHTIDCPHCAAPLQLHPPEDSLECPRCRRRLVARLFPGFSRGPPPQASSARALAGEATCFFHPEKIAAAACERCGRFICPLCEIFLGTRLLCPSCISRGLDGALPELVRSRVCWGNIALLLGLLPLLGALFVWPVLPFTGAAAVFTAIHSNGRPASLVRGKQRAAAITGLLLGLVQLLLVAAAVYFIWRARAGA